MYIAVYSPKAGEYSIKIDAHEKGLRGRLSAGITEGGFVEYEEFNQYLYIFEIWDTIEITFDVRLNVISGDADLYMKDCTNDCSISKEELTKVELLKVENNQTSKIIKNSFTCEAKNKSKKTECKFVIAVKGKENNGTHFDLSISEEKFHRLLLPGKEIALNMIYDE